MALFYASSATAARADIAPNPPTVLIQRAGAYDYAATGVRLQGQNTIHYFWCGQNVPGGNSDYIWHQTRPAPGTSGSPGTATAVLTTTAGHWDSAHVCDPTVVSGSFVYSGHTYAYALYYTGTDDTVGWKARVGVAFSDNLTTWVKYPNPVITPPLFQTNIYGAGQQVAYRTTGTAGVRMIYHDSTSSAPAGILAYRDSTNGISFGAPTYISTIAPGGDFAYDPSSNSWYGSAPAGPTGDMTSVALKKIDPTSFFGNANAWQNLITINPSVTGLADNHNIGFVRNGRGEVPVEDRPNLLFTFGGGSTATSTWDVYQTKWTFPGPPSATVASSDIVNGATHPDFHINFNIQNAPLTTWSCTIDGAPLSCPNPYSVTIPGLAYGGHDFNLHLQNFQGAFDLSPHITWVGGQPAPTIAIVGSNIANGSHLQYFHIDFSIGNTPLTSWACYIDGAPMTCGSPFSVDIGPLTYSGHSFVLYTYNFGGVASQEITWVGGL